MISEAKIQTEVKKDVGYITIDRPEKNNSVTLEMKEIIHSKLKEWQYRGLEDDVKVVVFQNSGTDCFCSGGDLQEVKNENFRLEPFVKTWKKLFNLMRNLGKPIVAKVSGDAYGGGFDLLLFCDIVIASEGSRLGQPEIELGILNHFSPSLLPRLVGMKNAFELLLTGQSISAERAERIGLINKAVPSEELSGTTDQIITSLKEKSPRVLKKMRESIYYSVNTTPDSALKRIESLALDSARNNPDMEEGVRAWLEDRS